MVGSFVTLFVALSYLGHLKRTKALETVLKVEMLLPKMTRFLKELERSRNWSQVHPGQERGAFRTPCINVGADSPPHTFCAEPVAHAVASRVSALGRSWGLFCIST